MSSIRFDFHSIALFVSAILFAWVVISDAVPAWIDGFVWYFGLMGAFHTASVVVSLRARPRIGKALGLVTAGAALSILTPFFMGIPGWIGHKTSIGTSIGEVGIWLIIAITSAMGAAAYWLVLRKFCDWKTLDSTDLLLTVALCATASVLSFAAGIQIANEKAPGVLSPTFAWWAAFSSALYISSRRRRHQLLEESFASNLSQRACPPPRVRDSRT